MNIIHTLKQEESKLQRQLTALREAIAAFNGSANRTMSLGRITLHRKYGKRGMSAAGRAKISRAAKARWARIRAERSKKAS